MQYFILPTKDLSKLFFLHARVIINASHQRQLKLKKTIVKLCFLHMPKLHKLILQLDQKAANCKTCKWLYGKFQPLIAHQLQENHSSNGKWVKFWGETWKGAGGEVGSLERVSLILIYIFMNSFIYTVFNLWITRSVRNKLLWALRYANVSLRCRHLW